MKNILREEKRPLLNKIFVGGTRKNSTPKGLGPLQRRLCDWWRWLRSASAGLVLSVSVVSLLSFTSTIADDYYIIGGGGRGVGQSGQYGGYGGYIGSGDSQYADSGYANKNKDGGGAFVGPKTYYGDSSYNGQGYCATNTSLNEQFNGSEGSGGGDGGKGGSVVATDGHPFSMTLPSVAGKLYIGGGCGGSANTGAGGAGGAGGDVLLDAGDIRHSGNITVTAGNGGTGGNSAANESSVGGAGGKVSLEANSIEAAGIIITAGDGNYAGRYAGGAGGDVSLTAGDIRTTTGGITVGAGKGGKDSSAAAGSAGGNVSLEAGDIITTSDFILTAGEGGEGSYGNSGAGGNISLEANAVTAPTVKVMSGSKGKESYGVVGGAGGAVDVNITTLAAPIIELTKNDGGLKFNVGNLNVPNGATITLDGTKYWDDATNATNATGVRFEAISVGPNQALTIETKNNAKYSFGKMYLVGANLQISEDSTLCFADGATIYSAAGTVDFSVPASEGKPKNCPKEKFYQIDVSTILPNITFATNSSIEVSTSDSRVYGKTYGDSNKDAFGYLEDEANKDNWVSALKDLGFIKPDLPKIVLPLDAAENAQNNENCALLVQVKDRTDIPITLNVTSTDGDNVVLKTSLFTPSDYNSNVAKALLRQSSADYNDDYGASDYTEEYESGVSKVTYSGDNSGFRGEFELSGNTTAEFLETGKIFGGDIKLQDSAKLIWRGGDKDAGNHPTITMAGASCLTFALPEGSNNVFSIYGIIKTAENNSDPQIDIESGKLYVKNDCSGFKGKVTVYPGAEFYIRTDVGASGQHKGQMFGGLVDVREGALAVFDMASASISDSTVSGTMQIGQDATFGNLNVVGGTLKILENVTGIHILKASFGSTLDTMNGCVAQVDVDKLEILAGENAMEWMLDFDVNNNTCDHILTKEFENTEDKPLIISDYRVLGDPAEDEYIFRVLNISNGNNYPHIDITNPLHETSHSVYKLSAPDRNGQVIMRILEGWNGKQQKEITEVYQPLHLAHSAVLANLKDTLDTVYDSPDGFGNYSTFGEKYHLWNKLTTYSCTFAASDGGSIYGEGCATMMGIDGESILLEDGCKLISTIFAGYCREKFNGGADSYGNSGSGGLKLSCLSENYGNLSFICSYGVAKSGNGNCKLRSYVFSLSSRYGNNFALDNNIFLVPLLQLDYSRIISENTELKNFRINEEDHNGLRAAIGLSLQFNDGSVKAAVGVKFNRRFRENIAPTCAGSTIPNLKKISGSLLELKAKISGKINDTVTIDLATAKLFGSKKGVSINLTMSANL